MRRRIVLVGAFAPSARGMHGGARALHGIAGELVRRHDVVLVHLAGGEIDPEIARRCVAVHVVTPPDPGPWGVRARGAAAVARGRSLKAAASSAGRLARLTARLARAHAPDVVQVESGILGDALAGVRGPLRVVTILEPAASLRDVTALRGAALPFAHRLDAWAAVREERRILARADAAVVFTAADADLIRRTSSPRAPLVTIPLGWDVPPAPGDRLGADPPALLFVGNFVHPPNVDAALTLARGILPRVRAEHPTARAQIVGASPPPELVALRGDAVDVTGAVASVVPYLDRAAVVVVPIALGGGMRVKVLEALAAGKAVVASTRAVEGLAVRSGHELVVCDGDEQTAAAVRRLLRDPAERAQLAARARTWALRELSWAAMADRYDALYARLQGRGA